MSDYPTSDPSVATRFFTVGGVAIRGIDPIGYFTQQRPVPGSSEFASKYLGFTFYHASADNRELFLSNPQKYAPQYGGYCALAMAEGAVATTIPEAFTIADVSTALPENRQHGELLYLNYSLPVRAAWRADMEGNVTRANHHWPEILVTYGPPR